MRKIEKYPGIILVILIVCIFIGVSIFIMNYVRESRVADVITVEAGTIMPEAGFYNGIGEIRYIRYRYFNNPTGCSTLRYRN